jgi:hypothetical protein
MVMMSLITISWIKVLVNSLVYGELYEFTIEDGGRWETKYKGRWWLCLMFSGSTWVGNFLILKGLDTF